MLSAISSNYESVARNLESVGIALLKDATTADLEALARALGTVRPHRDSSPDGTTIISPSVRLDTQAAMVAFTRDELPPHTDGSGVVRPADLVIGCCLTPPTTGGEILLVDGLDVLGALLQQAPYQVEPLWRKSDFAFGAERLRDAVFDDRAGRSEKTGSPDVSVGR